MRILITGATGFIGSRLALRARRQGHEPVATGLANTAAEAANREELSAAGIEVAPRSLEELAQSSELIRGSDAVIHLAAAQHEMNVPDAHFREVNVEGTRRLIEAVRSSAGTARFVHGSTIGVYGARDGLIDESTPTAPDNIYGETKLEAERLVLAHAGDQPVCVIRISEAYGPGDQRLLKLFRAVRSGRFVLIGDGRNLHHPIYIDDLLDLLLLSAGHDAARGQVFLAAGKEAVTTDEMVAAVAQAVGKPMPRLRVPLWPLAATAVALEATLRPLGIQPPLHRRRMDFFRKSFRLDGGKAARQLGFVPQIGFLEGARRTARWYEETGQLPLSA